MSLAINITIGFLVVVIFGLVVTVVIGAHSLKQHEETIHQQQDTISKQEDTINKQEDTIKINTTPPYNFLRNCTPLNSPSEIVQGNCRNGEVCGAMGCTTRCQNDDDCSKYYKYLPDDTLQWVCDKYGHGTGSTEKLCMVAPNPRVTAENGKEYLSTAEKNCSKLLTTEKVVLRQVDRKK